MTFLSDKYWEQRWEEGRIGWDIGCPSPPIKAYIDQLEDKTLKILIPGAGNAYEAEYLWSKGFKNVFVIDFSESAIHSFLNRIKDFPKGQALCLDFFELNENNFDLVLEQAFFCAIDPDMRTKYIDKMSKLLKPQGKLVGLLLDMPDKKDGPPFGGEASVYKPIFKKAFDVISMSPAHNSIKPRAGTELFLIAKLKDLKTKM